jgi:uncharacterized protein with HEPN domain
MAREFLEYLNDILNTANSIEKFVNGMSYEEFVEDQKTVFAVVQGFEIIGEAAKNIPGDVQKIYPEIDWQSMMKMRDMLIHHYFGTQYSILWETIKKRIPELIQTLPKILKDYGS